MARVRNGSKNSRDDARFVWPPRRPEPGPGPGVDVARPAVDAVSLPPRGVRWGVVEALRVWVGLIHDRFTERARESGWSPDDPTDYCPLCAASVRPQELGPDDRGRVVCAECRTSRLPWSGAVRLGEYEGLLREAVLEVKFGRDRRLGHDLGRLLGEVVNRRIDAEQAWGRPVVLVPAPMSTRRRLFRGIDHTLTLARGVRAATGGTIVQALRRRHGPSQVAVPASERRRNVSKAFRASVWAGFVPRNALVVFVDDVRTTGATALEGVRALKRAWKGDAGGREIWAAFVAATPRQAALRQ